MIYGDRVRQARELRGITQTELAQRLGVNQSTIAYVENGRLSPSDSLAHSIALQTGFPPSFLNQAPAVEFPLGSLLFRSRASTTSREETLARRHAQTVYEMAEKLMRRVRPIPLRLPMLDDYESPASAATITRAALGLSPDTPISSLIGTLEKGGVLVLALPLVLVEIDAFSLWLTDSSRRPVIAVSDGKPGDRLRFSIAHEVGHLVMHRAMKVGVAGAEKEANQFAGELLLPEAAMRRELVPPLTLSALPEMKRRWGVSMQAVVMRAGQLGIITERQKSYLFQQMAVRGWRKQEPPQLAIPVERPRALRQLAELRYGPEIDYQRLAADTHLSPSFLRDCMAVCALGPRSAPRKATNVDGVDKVLEFPGDQRR